VVSSGLPVSSVTSMACWFQESAVSMAIGVKMWVLLRSAYLAVFVFVALLAADADWAVNWRLSVSQQNCLERHGFPRHGFHTVRSSVVVRVPCGQSDTTGSFEGFDLAAA